MLLIILIDWELFGLAGLSREQLTGDISILNADYKKTYFY